MSLARAVASLGVALACCCVAGAALAADPRIGDWIGKLDDPAPNGWRAIVGTCLGSGETLCQESVGVMREEPSGARRVIATRQLQALDGSVPGGDRPLRQVTDALGVDALDDPDHEVSVGLCQRDGVADERLVAVVRPDVDIEWYTRFERLWRLDAQGRLQPADGRGVRCLNEGHGYTG